QALAAREQPRIAIGARQQLDGMIERFRLGIGKGRRLHAFPPYFLSRDCVAGDAARSMRQVSNRGRYSSLRLVKRALPRPVPMVSTPHRSTAVMKGGSLRPCTTASLCMMIAVSSSPILGIASWIALG